MLLLVGQLTSCRVYEAHRLSGDLQQAPMLEGLVALFQTLDRGELSPFFDRFNRPGEIATHQFGGSPLLRAPWTPGGSAPMPTRVRFLAHVRADRARLVTLSR